MLRSVVKPAWLESGGEVELCGGVDEARVPDHDGDVGVAGILVAPGHEGLGDLVRTRRP